jgi:RHS repeat-associated protein
LLGALIALPTLVPARDASALGGPSPGAVSAQTVKLPSGPGSVRGLADDAQVNGFTGQVAYSIPIELPSAPGGLAPSLHLGYDGDLGNGPIGVGWCFAQPGIRRSTRLGVPRYDATDELDVSGLVSGLPQLVAFAGPSGVEYRVEGQGNAYSGRAVAGGFELTAPDGKVYRFGTTAEGRKAAGASVAAWYLESVTDVAGQVIQYHYRSDRGETYMDSITWGPSVLGQPAFRADFVYEDRTDAVVSYRTGFRVEAAQRLHQIKVSSFGAVRRTVTLAYDGSFALSRLSGVQLASADGNTSLPSLAFHYAAASSGTIQPITGVDGWALNLQGTSLADVDGDGAMDLLRLTASGHSYRRNLGGRFDVPRTLPGAAGASLDQARLLDLTGDSAAELVRQQGSQWTVYQLTGDPVNPTWNSLGSWAGAQNVSLGTVTVADINGDQMMDIVSTSGSSTQVRFGTASGLGAPITKPAVDSTRSFIAPGNVATSYPDINGDGLADVVYLSTSSMFLYLGRGDGTFERYRDLPYPWTGSVPNASIRLGDLNRDGLLDVAVIRAGNVEWYRGLANGTLDPTPIRIARPAGTDASVVVALADANGNGSEDVVWSSDAGMWILDLAGPTSAGMLTSIDNGLGEHQAFGYGASSQLALADEAAGAPWATTLPISVPVATQTRVTLDSGDPARSSRLDVRDGIYDRVERRFVGFSRSVLSRPDPADGAPPAQIVRQVRHYAAGLGLDRALRGELLDERIETGAGTVIRATSHALEAVAVAGLPTTDGRLRKAVVHATESQHFEGQPTALVTRTEYLHDPEGRVTEEKKLGRLDLAGDEVITRKRYTTGRSSRGVRDLVCEEWVVGLDGTTEVPTSHTQTLFGDDQTTAALCDAGAGWTRVERSFLDGEARWVDRKTTTYSAHGNPLRTTEDLVARDVTYDAFDLHPIAEVTQPSATRTLRWEMTWDNVLGVPATVRDATGVVTEVTHDGLGRVLTVARGGHLPYLAYRYHNDGPRPSIETYRWDGAEAAITAVPATTAPGWRHEVTGFTSASEALFQATQLDATTWIIADRRQRDALGRTIAVADAFLWTGASPAAAALPGGTALRTVAYDALDRPTLQTIATGGHNTYAYRAFETTLTTDGMAPVVTALDGQDRIVHTQRTIAGVTESVDASYDAEGRITRMRLPAAAGNVDHSFVYDSLGRLVFASDPDIGNRTLAYDDGDRLISQSNGAGQTTTFRYDGVGRLIAKVGSDAQLTYHYDDALDPTTFGFTAGRLAYVDEPTGLVQLGYDELGREIRQRRSIAGKTADRVTSYAPSGLLLGTDDGDGLGFDVRYDAAGRPIGVGSLWSVEAQDPRGRVLRERFGNGVVQTYQRDPNGHATHLQVLPPVGGALYDVNVTYNAYGAVTQIADLDGVGLDHSATFGFDGGARLIDATLGSGAARYQFHYAYDGLQNMVQRTATGPTALGVLTGTQRYGEAGRGPRQLTSITPAIGAATTFDYDGAGRTIRQGNLVMDYNSFDQLVKVHTPSGIVAHDYGYDGLRVRSVAPSGAATLYFTPEISETSDGVRKVDVRVGDRLIAQVARTPGAPAAASAVTALGIVRGGALIGGALALLALLATGRRRRVWRPVTSVVTLSTLAIAGCGTMATGELAAELRTTSQILYYHQAMGMGPTLITRSDGSVYDERRYEPYGAPIDARHDGVTAGVDYVRDAHNALDKLSDPATGWSDHGARWNAPEAARWLTPDPPVKAPEGKYLQAPWGLNPYQYVKQNPVLYWDPDGKDEHNKSSEEEGDSWSDEMRDGALELFTETDASLGKGMIWALKPLQSDSVPTAVKIPYAIVAPIPMVCAGAVSTTWHVVKNTGHIVKGGVRGIYAGGKWVYRQINPAPVPVTMPVLDIPPSEEEVSMRSSSVAHDDPPPPPPKAAPVKKRPPRPPVKRTAPPPAAAADTQRANPDDYECHTQGRIAP